MTDREPESNVEREGAPSQGGAERSEATTGEGAGGRGRPGRRTVADRVEAVLAILAGKSSIDQVARRYGVRPETVEGWRDEAVAGMAEVLRRGDARPPRELELEKENKGLRDLVSTLSLERALAMKAVEEWKRTARPTRPARLRR